MNLLRESIMLQKEKSIELRERLDYFKIKDPVLNRYSYQLFCKNSKQVDTKAVADHFNNLEYLYYLYQSNYTHLRKNIFQSALICGLTCLFFLFSLLNTFAYLQIKSFSFIPILCLIFFAVFLVLFILNIIRIYMINKVISGEILIDRDFMKLIIILFEASLVNDHNSCL